MNNGMTPEQHSTCVSALVNTVSHRSQHDCEFSSDSLVLDPVKVYLHAGTALQHCPSNDLFIPLTKTTSTMSSTRNIRRKNKPWLAPCTRHTAVSVGWAFQTEDSWSRESCEEPRRTRPCAMIE